MLELYHNDMSTCAQKVRLVLAEKGLEWQSHHLKLREGEQLQPEYLQLNPKGLVPTLVDDGRVLVESNVIIEYLEDAYPEGPLRPGPAIERARMRWWMRQLDEDVHVATGAVSVAIAFRHQHLALRPTRAERETFYASLPNEAQRQREREIIEQGMESSYFLAAAARFRTLFDAMETTLEAHGWLAGAEHSLADIAYTPYLTRFEHLQLLGILTGRPRLTDWYDRVRRRPSYRTAIADWLDAEYLPLMREHGARAWPRFGTLFDAA